MKLKITNQGDVSWFEGEPFEVEKGVCCIYGNIEEPQLLVSYQVHDNQVQAELNNKEEKIYNDTGFIDCLAAYFESLGVDKETSRLFDWSEYGLQDIYDGYNYSHFDIQPKLARALEDAVYGKTVSDVEFDYNEE